MIADLKYKTFSESTEDIEWEAPIKMTLYPVRKVITVLTDDTSNNTVDMRFYKPDTSSVTLVAEFTWTLNDIIDKLKGCTETDLSGHFSNVPSNATKVWSIAFANDLLSLSCNRIQVLKLQLSEEDCTFNDGSLVLFHTHDTASKLYSTTGMRNIEVRTHDFKVA